MIAILVFVLGAVLGSFLNVVILRLPKDQPLTGRSHCMRCKHQLEALDLVPVLSYLGLRGRCRYCGKKISPRYMIIELISAVLLTFAYLFYMPHDAGSLMLFVRAGFILLVLLATFVIDYEHFLILDKIVFPASFILLLLNFFTDFAAGSVAQNSLVLNGILATLGLLVFFGGIYFLSGGRWMGFGDVKLTLFLGLAAPYPFVFANIFVAFLIGAVVGLVLLGFGGKNMKSQVPFGTMLAVSTAITLFYGPQLLNFYLRTVGLWYLAKY